MIAQKSDESIEEIDRQTLFEYIGSKDFLAVLFCGCLNNISLSIAVNWMDL